MGDMEVHSSTYRRQAAVLAVHAGRVCLITSRSSKRWVIPKGNLEPDMSAGEAALQEAWEEAGLTGILQREPIGSYLYEKAGGRCRVTVFLMEVTQVSNHWPERQQRSRRWLRPERALPRIDEPGLRRLLNKVIEMEMAAGTA